MTAAPSYIPIIGPIVAATIAGTVAFLASVFTKEAKVSEFRQAWIDGLRNDLAEFASAYHYVTQEVQNVGQGLARVDANQVFSSLKDEFLKIEQMQSRIELRLNPTEHAHIIRQVRSLVRYEPAALEDFMARRAAVQRLLEASQLVLKNEWVVVKRGEPAYFATKWISLSVAVAAVLFAALIFSQNLTLSWR